MVSVGLLGCGTAPEADQSYQVAAQDRIEQITAENGSTNRTQNNQDATRSEIVTGSSNELQIESEKESWQQITNGNSIAENSPYPPDDNSQTQNIDLNVNANNIQVTPEISGTTEVFPVELPEKSELPAVDPINDLPEVVQELPTVETPAPEQPVIEMPVAVTPAPPTVSPEVPQDPIFALSMWNLNLSGGAIAQNITQGNALTTTIQTAGTEVWNVQPTHLFDFKVGSEYEIEIQAHAAQNRPINVKVELNRQPWTNALNQNFNLTESSKTFKVGFNYNGPSQDMRISLNYGGSNGDVYIERILIREILP